MLLLTADEMRALDAATIRGGVPGEELMERAGRGIAEALERHFGSPLALRVLVLCGPGNNGGDGFVAARHLASRGARVAVGVVVPREKIAGDAAAHLAKLEVEGPQAVFATDDAALAQLVTGMDRWDFAIDALLGTGASGEPRGVIATACEALNLLHNRGTRVVAADLPTGVSADTGAASDLAVRADLTVTFGHAKRGHFLFPGRSHRGELDVIDIGLVKPETVHLDAAELSQPVTLAEEAPRRDPRAHKGTAGRVLIVGGAQGMVGATVLAARAASRAGAGYVRVAAPASLHDALASQLVEQMPVACGEGVFRSLTVTALAQILAEAAHADAVAVGPGLSRYPDSVKLVHALAPKLDMPVVLDADALNAFAPPDGDLAEMLRTAPGPRILTPHLGEMARLTGEMPSALETRRIDAAREWAQRWKCVLVLKGAPTVIANEHGQVCVNPTGNPGMATAGMGDVLTGTIAALLAQKLLPYDAARFAVFMHGLAGDLAAREVGAVGLTAGDVVERLPRALAMITAAR
jgi:ADP-dependent NAD(P)H-hydrate dehydratase / NAD(P)H-hydrate epimerase